MMSREGDAKAPDISTVIDESNPFPPIQKVHALQAFVWLKKGFEDFKAQPRMSLFYGFCFAGMGGALSIVLKNAPQYLSALTCGFLLLGPLLALGLYDISRRIENHKKNMMHSVYSLRGRWNNIGILAVVLAVIMLIWARASLVVFALFYNKGMPSMESFFIKLFSADHIEFLIAYACVGFIFASLVFAISWVSIPLMLDRDTDSITAMIVSIVALFANIPVTIVWSWLIVGMVALSFLTLHIGFIFFMPVIGHATWHAYKDIVGQAETMAS